MKIFVSSYNGVLDEYKRQIDYAPPRDADKMVMWQACEGSWGLLAETCKKFFPKPLYVMQHGRRASRDYYKPCEKPFNEDVFLAWGKWDAENVRALGHKAEIVGCPLNPWIKPKIAHKEKVILFVPVNTGKEEPDNIRVYTELLKMKLGKVQEGLDARYDDLRRQWNSEGITKHTLSDNWTILTKVLPWHDQKFYTEGVIKGMQDAESNNKLIFDILRNVDLVVGLDEGTTELFALAHDVPVIVVDGFKYKWTQGEFVQPPTPGFRHCKLEDLAKNVEDYLAHPEKDRKERLATAENEMSIQSIKDPVAEIHKIVGTK